MSFSADKLVIEFETIYKLRTIFAKELSEMNIGEHRISLLERNENFKIMMVLITDAFLKNKTKLDHIPKKEMAQYKDLVANDDVFVLYDYVFYKLKKILKRIKKVIDEMENRQLAQGAIKTILDNMDIILYITFVNTIIIPPEIVSTIITTLNMIGTNENKLITHCKNVIRELSNEFYICDFNPKNEYPKNERLDSFISKISNFVETKRRNASLPYVENNNVPIDSPYAVLLLTSIIIYLRKSDIQNSTIMRKKTIMS